MTLKRDSVAHLRVYMRAVVTSGDYAACLVAPDIIETPSAVTVRWEFTPPFSGIYTWRPEVGRLFSHGARFMPDRKIVSQWIAAGDTVAIVLNLRPPAAVDDPLT